MAADPTHPSDKDAADTVPDPIQDGPTVETQLEADSQDADSAFAADPDDDGSLTASLSSSIVQYRVENGRTYHQYKDGQYVYPNDELEKDRLDLQHHIYKLMLDQRLYVAPIKDNIQNVLDIGTGTGLWAIEYAEQHPAAVVIGTDLSPIQPQFVPPNLSFLIDDATEEWIFKQKFDYVHCRQLHGAIPEKHLLKQAFDNLVPGGWIEIQEISMPEGNDDGTNDPSNSISQWSKLMMEAAERIGTPLDNPTKHAEWMRGAGFVNVKSELHKLASNPWPKAKKDKTLGLWNLANMMDGVEGFTMAMFTRVLGWQPEAVQVFLEGVRADTRNRAIHNYYPVYLTYGQKPE